MTVIIMLTLYRVYWVISVWPRSVAALWGFVISPSFILQHFWYSFVFVCTLFYIRLFLCAHFFIFVSYISCVFAMRTFAIIYPNARYSFHAVTTLFLVYSSVLKSNVFAIRRFGRMHLLIGFDLDVEVS